MICTIVYYYNTVVYFTSDTQDSYMRRATRCSLTKIITKITYIPDSMHMTYYISTEVTLKWGKQYMISHDLPLFSAMERRLWCWYRDGRLSLDIVTSLCPWYHVVMSRSQKRDAVVRFLCTFRPHPVWFCICLLVSASSASGQFCQFCSCLFSFVRDLRNVHSHGYLADVEVSVNRMLVGKDPFLTSLVSIIASFW